METVNINKILANIGLEFLSITWCKIILCFKKLKIKFWPINFNLALSFDFTAGLNSDNYFKEIKKNLKQTLNQNHLNSIIKIEDISDIYKFKTIDEAKAFIKDKKLDLIIWCDFSTEGLQLNNKNVCELKLWFIYGHPKDKHNKLGQMISLDLHSNLAKKNYWRIFEDNSFEDVKIISSNLYHISMYIIGVTAKIFGKIEKSLLIFDTLYEDLLKFNDPFIIQIKPHLINCYELVITDIIMNLKNIEKGETYCKKLLKLKEGDHFAIANLSLFLYKLGKIEESQKMVELLQKLHPKSPITELDIAFFRILQKKYNNAYDHYINLIKFTPEQVGFKPLEVVEFLYENYKKIKDPALLFASGLISYYFGDKKLAQKDLKKFLKMSNEETYKPMYRYTKKLLST